jgi:hypothetical protein
MGRRLLWRRGHRRARRSAVPAGARRRVGPVRAAEQGGVEPATGAGGRGAAAAAAAAAAVLGSQGIRVHEDTIMPMSMLYAMPRLWMMPLL